MPSGVTPHFGSKETVQKNLNHPHVGADFGDQVSGISIFQRFRIQRYELIREA